MDSEYIKQDYDYFVILDFKSANTKVNRFLNINEIIEFSAFIVRTSDFAIVDRFHNYVKPTYFIASNISKLTGIRPSYVKNAPYFKKVYIEFIDWIDKYFENNKSWCFLTRGDWDLKTLLPEQCKSDEIFLDYMFLKWININSEFEELTDTLLLHGKDFNDLLQMMDYYEIKHEGRLHEGRHDVQNLFKLVRVMCKDHKLALSPTCANVPLDEK